MFLMTREAHCQYIIKVILNTGHKMFWYEKLHLNKIIIYLYNLFRHNTESRQVKLQLVFIKLLYTQKH